MMHKVIFAALSLLPWSQTANLHCVASQFFYFRLMRLIRCLAFLWIGIAISKPLRQFVYAESEVFPRLLLSCSVNEERKKIYEAIYARLKEHHRAWRLSSEMLKKASLKRRSQEFSYWIALREIPPLFDGLEFDLKKLSAVKSLNERYLEIARILKYVEEAKADKAKFIRTRLGGRSDEYKNFEEAAQASFDDRGYFNDVMDLQYEDYQELQKEGDLARLLGLFQESNSENYWVLSNRHFGEIKRLKTLIDLYLKKVIRETKLKSEELPEKLRQDERFFAHRQWLFERFLILEELVITGQSATLSAIEFLINLPLH